MNTHYQTLGVAEQASADDIRRAYRRLVLLTHPDRTPDPAAHAQYLAVNDAYEVLSSPRRRASYDALLWALRNPPPPPPSPTVRRPAADRAALARRPTPRRRAMSTEEKYAAEYVRYAPYARWLSWVALALCTLLLLDYMATTSAPTTIQVLDGFTRREPGIHWGPGRHRIETESLDFEYENFEYEATSGGADSLYVGKVLRRRQTPLFGILRRVETPRQQLSLYEPATIYSPFAFIPLLLLTAAGIGLASGSTDRRRVEAAICLLILLPICLFILFYAD